MRDSYEFEKPVKPSKPVWTWCIMFAAFALAAMIVGGVKATEEADFIPGLVSAGIVLGGGTAVIGVIKGIYNSAMKAKGREVFGISPVFMVMFGALTVLGSVVLMAWKEGMTWP